MTSFPPQIMGELNLGGNQANLIYMHPANLLWFPQSPVRN